MVPVDDMDTDTEFEDDDVVLLTGKSNGNNTSPNHDLDIKELDIRQISGSEQLCLVDCETDTINNMGNFDLAPDQMLNYCPWTGAITPLAETQDHGNSYSQFTSRLPTEPTSIRQTLYTPATTITTNSFQPGSFIQNVEELELNYCPWTDTITPSHRNVRQSNTDWLDEIWGPYIPPQWPTIDLTLGDPSEEQPRHVDNVGWVTYIWEGNTKLWFVLD